ncbi:MAG TPA: transcriptional regulator [Coriobacteriia bacterium]|nr:transcriptional regulator [Coriobacteriia bacterium]
MDLGGCIRDMRERDGLSQEALAERIYVTRQTIINWEAGRSYPDVQSLLLLGAVFDISIDEMVKGDVDTMKHELDVYKLKVWNAIAIAAVILAVLVGVPFYAMFGMIGLIPSLILVSFAIVAGLIVDRIAKSHCLLTFEEIITFMNTGRVVGGLIAWTDRHSALTLVVGVPLLLFGGYIIGRLLGAWSHYIETLIG